MTTPLIEAVCSNDLDEVETLLNVGVDINATNNDGDTALMVASINGDTKIVQVLIERGADVNATNKDGETALLIALYYGYTEIVEMIEQVLEDGMEEQQWLNAPLGELKETTPDGLDQHATGAKLDSGKVRLGLVLGSFSKALTKVGVIGTDGANKYTDNGWKDVKDGEARYMDAACRHLLQHFGGEVVDKDSGSEHLGHVAWNILAVLELRSRDNE